MASVYLETSFISACVIARKDPASVYRRETSMEWWTQRAQRHDLYVSVEVQNELSHSKFAQRDDALLLIKNIPRLEINFGVADLAELLVREKAMPAPASGDAIHVAVATFHEIEYILSWNVRHLANVNKMKHLTAICLRAGLVPPIIVTPEFL